MAPKPSVHTLATNDVIAEMNLSPNEMAVMKAWEVLTRQARDWARPPETLRAISDAWKNKDPRTLRAYTLIRTRADKFKGINRIQPPAQKRLAARKRKAAMSPAEQEAVRIQTLAAQADRRANQQALKKRLASRQTLGAPDGEADTEGEDGAVGADKDKDKDKASDHAAWLAGVKQANDQSDPDDW